MLGVGGSEESIIKLISAEAEAEACLGFAELGNILLFTIDRANNLFYINQ